MPERVSVPSDWATLLRTFLARLRKGEVPDRRELSTLEERQSQVSGGALLKFLRFMTGRENLEKFPELKEADQADKTLVFLTDRPGSVAAHDIFRMFRPGAVWVLAEEWEAWRQHPEAPDPSLEAHIEYWNVWRARNTRQEWIHVEGYRLSPERSSEMEHLWAWQDDELQLITPQWRRKS